jgi:hypothetical protein
LEEEIEARDDCDLACVLVHTQLPHLRVVAPSYRICPTGVSCSIWALIRQIVRGSVISRGSVVFIRLPQVPQEGRHIKCPFRQPSRRLINPTLPISVSASGIVIHCLVFITQKKYF